MEASISKSLCREQFSNCSAFSAVMRTHVLLQQEGQPLVPLGTPPRTQNLCTGLTDTVEDSASCTLKKARWDLLDISPGAGNLHQIRELLLQGHRVQKQPELVYILFF